MIRRLEQDDFESIADEIISVYLEKKNITKEDLPQKVPSLIVKESKGNLWVLAYFLKGIEKGKDIRMETVYDNVKDDLVDLRKEFEEKYGLTKVWNVLLCLAPFSRLETGVSELFFDDFLNQTRIEFNTVKRLKNYGEIQFKNGYYYVPHSTLARLYLETTTFRTSQKNYTFLSDGISKYLSNSDFSGKNENMVSEMLQLYILGKPTNLADLMYEMGRYHGHDFKRKIFRC